MIIQSEAEAFMSQWGVLHRALAMGASDVIFCAGTPVCARINGDMTRLEPLPLSKEQMDTILRFFTDSHLLGEFQHGDLDYTLEFPSLQRRFRVNAFRQNRGHSLVLRVLPNQILSLEELGIPATFAQIFNERSGLVLVTGTTGSGKSTTLSSVIEELNRTRSQHIITIEDPIEYVFNERRAVIQQREVGRHVGDFHEALKSALRQSPDVIFVGEIRDAETAQITLRSAQIGILVLATLHTRSAAESISRFVGFFEDSWRSGIRLQLADSIRAILCQRLVPRTDKGRLACCEVMWATAAMRHVIRDDKLHLMHSLMEVSGKDGMVTMEQSLLDAYRSGVITLQSAFENANDKLAFLAQLPAEHQKRLAAQWETDIEFKRLEQLRETQKKQVSQRMGGSS